MLLVRNVIAIVVSALTFGGTVIAGVPTNLPYPADGNLTADQVADQVYFVNHFYANKNYSIQVDGRAITVLLSKADGEKPTTTTLSRYLKNDYGDNNSIKARDLIQFHSGKLKGTGMLFTDYVEDSRSQTYALWLPQLRKIRRFQEPGHGDSWSHSDFTYGDVTLRKPHHENHELMGKEIFNDCLGAMKIAKHDRSKYTRNLPEPACIKNREVYKLKSKSKFPDWWYDYRVSYVDTETFADHRTEYFKGGKKIKVIDRHWGQFPGNDKRNQYWKYWYGATLANGHETWLVVPDTVTHNNQDLDDKLWSESTLRKIKR